MKLSNKAFDIIRFLCELLVPAIGTLYLGISRIWGLPFGDEVAKTCVCVSAFLGTFIGISRNAYKKTADLYEGIEDD